MPPPQVTLHCGFEYVPSAGSGRFYAGADELFEHTGMLDAHWQAHTATSLFHRDLLDRLLPMTIDTVGELAQRVTATYHIGSLDRAAVAGYMQHRLQHVGGTGSEFTAEAIDLIHQHTHGIPRLVNKLCDVAMVYAATEERRVVDAAIVEEVLDDGIFLPAAQSIGEAAE